MIFFSFVKNEPDLIRCARRTENYNRKKSSIWTIAEHINVQFCISFIEYIVFNGEVIY